MEKVSIRRMVRTDGDREWAKLPPRNSKDFPRLLERSGKPKVGTKDAQRKFLQRLFSRCTKGSIEIRAIPTEVGARKWIPVKSIEIPTLPSDKSIYFGVATRKKDKGKKEDVLQIPAVWADIDFKTTPEVEAKEVLDRFPLKPSIQVHSGGGWHLYWLLKQPAGFADIERIEDVNRRIATHFGGDPAVAEAAHLLRLPYTMNFKYPQARKVSLLTCDENRLFDINDFDFLPPVTKAIRQTGAGQYSDFLKGVPEGQRVTRTTQLTGHFLGKNIAVEEVREILGLWNGQNIPPLPEKELLRTINGIHQKHITEKSDGVMALACDELNLVEVLGKSIISLSDFLQEPIPEMLMLLSPWLRQGNIALISAKGGLGKTWLGLSIAIAVSHNLSVGPWQSVASETRAGVVYIDGEVSEYELQQRFLYLSSGYLLDKREQKAPLSLISTDRANRLQMPSINIADENWRDATYKFLAERPELKLLILDNLASLAPGYDENVKKDWDAINQWLLRLRFKKISVIMMHHTGKKGEQRGTSAREDNIDVSIKLTELQGSALHGGGVRFKVQFTKNRSFYGQDAESFCMHLKPGNPSNPWVVEDKDSTTKSYIIVLLAKGNGMRQNEIAKIVKCRPPYVSIVKKEAEKDGYLDTNGDFTPAGEAKYGNIDIEDILQADEN